MAVIMTYKGYIGRVEFDEDENMLHGRIMNIRDVVTFLGRTVGEVRKALKDSVEDYLAFCAERKREPNRPYSGKLMLRIDPPLHAAVAAAAAQSEQSINEYVTSQLQHAVGAGA
jgi:predicted HicB family RNase H-like nuclease